MSKNTERYWQANVRLMLVLLFIWFATSFGAGILFADFLDQFRLFGFKLGYWFSHQGSIFVFVGLIFYYVWRMNRLDREYGVEESDS